MKIMGADVKSLSELGNDTSKQIQDTQIYTQGSGKILKQAILDGDYGPGETVSSYQSVGTVGLPVNVFTNGQYLASTDFPNQTTLYGWQGPASDGNWTDASGNGKTLTRNGSLDLTADMLGNQRAIGFDGVNDYLSSADSAFAFNGVFSSGFWVYQISWLPLPVSQLLLSRDGISTNGWLYYLYNGTINFGTRQSNAMTVQVTAQTSDLSPGWHYICVVRGTSSTSLYIDGVLVSKNNIATAFTATGNLEIGSAGGGQYKMTGAIQDIWIHNGTAWTDAQVKTIWQKASPTYQNQTIAGHTLTLANEPGIKQADVLSLYPFGGTLTTDLTGTYGLTNVGGVTNAVGIFGEDNGSAYFNGSSYFTQASLLATMPSEVSMMGWFRFEDGQPAGVQYLMRKMDNAAQQWLNFGLNTAGNLYASYLLDGVNDNYIFSKTVFPNGATGWHHIAISCCVRDGLKMWINGNLENQRSVSAMPAGGSTYPMTIGADHAGNGKFTGSLTQFRVMQRALTQDDVDIAYSSTPIDMTSTANDTFMNHGRKSSAIYNIPTAAANKRFTFMHQGLTGVNQFTNKAIIAPAAGDQIFLKNGLAVNPGYLTLNKPGSSITLSAIDTDSWIVTSLSAEAHEKNSSAMGQIVEDVSLVGRDSWITKANIGAPRSSAAGFSLNNYGYMCNGSNGSATSEVNQYNENSNIWMTRAPAVTARQNCSGFTLNGFGYICNGAGPSSSEVNKYNDATDSWSTMAPDLVARAYTSCFSLNGYSYVCDGATGVALATVNRYNDALNTWLARASGGTARADVACFGLNGFGYICGGYQFFSEVNQYNDSGDFWLVRSPILVGRFASASFSNNGYGYVCDGASTPNLSNVDQYNDSSNVWTAKAPGGTARSYLTGFSYNGNGYICTGSEVNQYN